MAAPALVGLSTVRRVRRRFAALEMLALFLLVSLLAWNGLLPGWRILGTDFPNYYVAARLIDSHYCMDRLYDWIWFQRIAGKFGIEHQLVGFLGLTPFSALPVIPVSWLGVLEAKRAWLASNLALLAVAVYLLSHHTGISYRRTWLVALCAVIPLRTSFLFGQMHIAVLVLLAAAYICHMRGRQIGSGCFIAIAAALKVYPIFFCFYFLVKRRWKALGATVVGIMLCGIVTYLIAGCEALTAYLLQQLPRSLQGESGNPFLASLTSSSALFHRLFLYEPELNPQPLVSSPLLYALLYPLWQAMLAGIVLSRLRSRFRADDREALEWSAFLCLLMFLSSSPASYQFVVLVAAAVPTISVLMHQRRFRAAAAFLFLYIGACNLRTFQLVHPTPILVPWLYLKLWCGVILIAFYVWILTPPQSHRGAATAALLPPAAFRLAALILFLWIPGAYGAWSHLRGMRPSNFNSLAAEDDAYLRTSPVSTPAGLLYIAMGRQGYRVRGTHSPLPLVSSNQLNFAADPSGQNLWIETVSNAVPRIAPILLSSSAMSDCHIDDAQAPALSNDGTMLAFVREDHGHGSLWALDLSRCASPATASPVRLTPTAFDVRAVSATTDGVFLASTVIHGKEQVIAVAPSRELQRLAATSNELDSPALSPDGKLLAVRELVAERWQLALLDLSSHRWNQLTHGDCNAYTPSWRDNRTLLYATDCMRGLGLTTLESTKINR